MTHASVRRAALAGALLITAACASSGSSAGTATGSPTPAPSASPDAAAAPRRTDHSRLTPDEIAASRETNMYDVISKLRPQWLLTRGISSSNSDANVVQVYVDGVKQSGGVQSLRQVEPGRVMAAQRIDGVDANTRFGMGNAGGAILIATRG